MFIFINKQGVQSDKGFIVQRTERFKAEYRENGKVITVYVEPGWMTDNRPCLAIQSTAFQSWDGEDARLTVDEQLRMLKNFREALEFQNMGLLVS